MIHNTLRKIANSVASLAGKVTDNVFFEQALSEIESDSKNKGTWAKALSLSAGNKGMAESRYIQLRASQLQEEQRQNESSKTAIETLENERDYELINQQKLENSANRALKVLGSVIGFYKIIGISVIALIVVASLFGEFDAYFILIFLGCIVLILPFYIIKFLSKKPLNTFKRRKKRINIIFLITILSSGVLVFLGAIIALALIGECIIFNRRTSYK